MLKHEHQRDTLKRQHQRGFTMVEIAICLAVIGFALVAIIGVLPLGIQVQTDNRQETIINHDGTYFLDAIRKGAPTWDLTNYVEEISLTYSNAAGTAELVHTTNRFRDSHHIIGLLSNPDSVRTEAIVRALNGVASEKGDYNNDLAFKYKVTAIVRPLESLDPIPSPTLSPLVASNLYYWQTNLTHEVRLVFRYPLTHDKKTGAGKKVFRALVGGRMNQHPLETLEYFFYRHGLADTTISGPPATNISNIYAP
jgi:prepilin-type N-terminal cleavage/methylation domain-containing protein